MSVTRRYGSAKKARAALKGRGGSGSLRKLKADETLKVRFLQQPEDWEEAYYHYIDNQFSWCNRKKSCDGCTMGLKPSKVALANVLDVQEGKVVIMQMPASLADQVLKRYEKFGETVMDRDYELSREGSGKNDTRYSADYDPPRKRDLSKYEVHDIGAAILSEMGEEEDDDIEDEEPRSSRTSSGKSRSASRSRRRDDDDEDEDFEEEDEEDEEEEEVEDERPRRRPKPASAPRRSTSRRSRHEDEDDEEDEEEEPRPRRTSTKSKKYDGLDEFKPKSTRNPAPARRVVRRSR